MNLLALDTSTHYCSCALLYQGEIEQVLSTETADHGSLLLSMINELLSKHSVSLSSLDAIVYGKGPGSFTGLRIGASVAQGIALSGGLPVIGVSSLKAMALAAYNQYAIKQIAVALDARMNQVYWATYQFSDDGAFSFASEEQVLSPIDTTQLSNNSWLLVGNGFEYADLLARQELGMHTLDTTIYPQAKTLLVLAENEQKIQSGLAEPIYIRNNVARKKGEK